MGRAAPTSNSNVPAALQVQHHHSHHGHVHWSSTRKCVHAFIEGSFFKGVVLSVIILNMCLVVYETDVGAQCDPIPPPPECDGTVGIAWAQLVNSVFLAVYVLEMVLRLFTLREAYFQNPVDIFDGCIVIVGVVGAVLGSALSGASILRIFRVARVGRALKVAAISTEMKVMLDGLRGASRAIAGGTVLIMFAIIIWALIFVMLINPLNQEIAATGYYENTDCDRCANAYASIAMAAGTFLQTIVMADEWGTYSMPIIERAPWTVLLFVAAHFSIVLGLMNLILSTIVDGAVAAQADATSCRAAMRKNDLKNIRKVFGRTCHEADTDDDGSLTMSELNAALENDYSELGQMLTVMEVSQEDMTLLFSLLDTDNDGRVPVDVFAEQMCNLKTQDTHTMLWFVKLQVDHLSRALGHDQFNSTRLSPAPATRMPDDSAEAGLRLSPPLPTRLPDVSAQAGPSKSSKSAAAQVAEVAAEVAGKGTAMEAFGPNRLVMCAPTHCEDEFSMAPAVGPAVEPCGQNLAGVLGGCDPRQIESVLDGLDVDACRIQSQAPAWDRGNRDVTSRPSEATRVGRSGDTRLMSDSCEIARGVVEGGPTNSPMHHQLPKLSRHIEGLAQLLNDLSVELRQNSATTSALLKQVSIDPAKPDRLHEPLRKQFCAGRALAL